MVRFPRRRLGPDSPTALLIDPVYVVAEPYRADSAGVQALHKLCQMLRERGIDSYIVPSTRRAAGSASLAGPPILTPKMARAHRRQGKLPVVVYPETILGNPLGATRVVRYFLNFPQTYAAIAAPAPAPGEMVVAFSEAIAESLGTSKVLFVPPVDVATLPTFAGQRQGAYLYAAKYRRFLGQAPSLEGVSFTEIHREGRLAQSRDEVLRMLSMAEVLYCFENSAITIEATLMGTPVVMVRNPLLKELIGREEVGTFGYAWFGDSIAHDADWVEQAHRKYSEALSRLPDAVTQFICGLQEMSHSPRFPAARVPIGLVPIWARASAAIGVSRNVGLRTLAARRLSTLTRMYMWRKG